MPRWRPWFAAAVAASAATWSLTEANPAPGPRRRHHYPRRHDRRVWGPQSPLRGQFRAKVPLTAPTIPRTC